MKKLYIYIFISFVVLDLHGQTTSNCIAPTATESLDINQITAHIRNDGSLWFDGANNIYDVGLNSLGNSTSTLFAGGLWLGGIDISGNLKVAAMTYRQDGHDFWPGPIDSGSGTTDASVCGQFDEIYKVHQSTISAFVDGLTLTAVQEEELYNYPGRGNPHMGFTMPNQDIAPFIDVDSDGIYDPDNGDYPDILGDQCMYFIMNDIGNTHMESGGNALGIEIGVRVFAFADTLESSTFYEYSITNKSGQDYYDFVFGQWIDPDLGEYQDDFVGCDASRNMGYIYNGDDFDEGINGFQDEIPLQGIQIVCGPTTTNGAQYSLRSFMSYDNNFSNYGNPENAQHYYNYLSSKWKDNSPLTYGGNGQDPAGIPTDFMYPDSPDDATGWSECSAENNPSDRRFIMSSGYYNFESGEELRFLVAAHTAYNVPHPCPDISALQAMADEASSFCTDNGLTSDGPEVREIMVTTPNFYPSPAVDELYFDSETSVERIRIFSADGKLMIRDRVGSASSSVNVSDLVSGVYVIEFEMESGQIGRDKLVISKK